MNLGEKFRPRCQRVKDTLQAVLRKVAPTNGDAEHHRRPDVAASLQ